MTPVSSRKTRLLLAGGAWSTVGAGLLAAGVHWSLAAPPGRAALLLALAAVGGWAKGRFLLRPRAEKNAARILASQDGRCAGGAFSWPSWLFVASMMVAGALLRRSAIPRIVLGFVYASVGAALLSASAVAWRHWMLLRRTSAGAVS
jgi:hypothetical protein